MKICITSSSSVQNESYISMAKNYIESLIDLDIELLCGGVGTSMMKEVYQTFVEHGKNTTCYTLACYDEEKLCENTVLLDTTFDRTKKLYEESDIICILPGGSGSLAEIFSFIEEARTQETKPIILVNENNFFDLILKYMHKLIQEGFNEESIMDYIVVVNSKEELKEKVEGYYGKINNGKISESL